VVYFSVVGVINERKNCLHFMDYSKIIKCMNFAAVKHCNQRRKDYQETPYINHPVGKCPLRRLWLSSVDGEALKT